MNVLSICCNRICVHISTFFDIFVATQYNTVACVYAGYSTSPHSLSAEFFIFVDYKIVQVLFMMAFCLLFSVAPQCFFLLLLLVRRRVTPSNNSSTNLFKWQAQRKSIIISATNPNRNNVSRMVNAMLVYAMCAGFMLKKKWVLPCKAHRNGVFLFQVGLSTCTMHFDDSSQSAYTFFSRSLHVRIVAGLSSMSFVFCFSSHYFFLLNSV